MAVGKLNVTPVTVRGLPSAGLNDARLFVGCYIQESEKHRTHSENGPEPLWKNVLTCTVPEGQNFLHVELVNENPNNGGIVATSKLALNQVFNQGNETKWTQLTSSSGQPYGELKLELSFSGTNSVSSVTSSFGSMNLAGGEQVSYKQTTTHSQSTTHNYSDSRQSSYSSLGPANPIPSNYGSGSPPPFTPPAAVSYPEKSGNNTMPGSGMPAAAGLASGGNQQRPPYNIENMTKSEFEVAKEKGDIPSWVKYGGGVLAGAAAIGLTAWGAHELKEHYDDKKEEEERLKKEQEHKQNKPFVPPPGYLQQEGQHHQQQGEKHNQYPQPPQQHPIQVCPQPPQYQSDKKEHKSDYKEHKKEKKDKKDKHHKKHDSDSSSSSDSDSSDDERKGKKDKHHKKKDSEWR